MEEVLDILFKENSEDTNKSQEYKQKFMDGFTYQVEDIYKLIQMYDKQKQLQNFLSKKGKTQKFPEKFYEVKQPDVQLAIYHLFCMQIEYQELKVEIEKLKCQTATISYEDTLDARFELIDMFFFMFNVGIYTGLDIESIKNSLDLLRPVSLDFNEVKDWSKITFDYLDQAIIHLMNYIDKLPWKAWKEYDYDLVKSDLSNSFYTKEYSEALALVISWAREFLNEDFESLFQLYMTKWEENHRRQEDINSGYILQ